MSGTTFTFRVDDTLKAQFTQAAKSQDRSSAQLLRHFMREFVRQAQEAEEYDGWFAQEVQKAIVSANTGDVLSAEDVEAQAAAWRAEMRHKLSGA